MNNALHLKSRQCVVSQQNSNQNLHVYKNRLGACSHQFMHGVSDQIEPAFGHLPNRRNE